jgi:hypothetical protein
MISSQALGKTAHRLRRFGLAHRCLRWFRRVLGTSLSEAVLEFARVIWRNSDSFGPPSAHFSLYQALRTGDPHIRGRVLATDQGTPRAMPSSLLVRSGLHQHKEQPWPIFWGEIPKARLVNQSLALLQPGKRLAIESVYGLERIRTDPAFRYFRLAGSKHLDGPWTSIVSRWVPVHGPCNYTHWLLDALPRLALLDDLPPETSIIVPGSLSGWQKESLELMGVFDRCRPTSEEHLLIDRYYFSSPTAMLDCYNPYGVKFLRDIFLSKDMFCEGPRRFVLKRAGKWRPAANEAEMYRLFEKYGWAVIDTERLTFAQEVALFNHADAVAGLLGSGLTNVVFCRPGCSVIHIVPDFCLDGWLDWIVQVVGCNYEFVVCESDYRQSFNVDLQWLESALQRLDRTA